jgi:hypothetical protein
MQTVGRALFDATGRAAYERGADGPVGDPATGGGWLTVPLDAASEEAGAPDDVSCGDAGVDGETKGEEAFPPEAHAAVRPMANAARIKLLLTILKLPLTCLRPYPRSLLDGPNERRFRAVLHETG